MELSEYLAVLRRHWRIWVGTSVLALMATGLILQLTPPTYEATARVFVAASGTISNSASFVNQRAKSYPGVATSQAVLAPVIQQLELDVTPGQLRTRISADNPVDTSQVHVSVTGENPAEAAMIANAVAEQLARVVEELETPESGDGSVTLTVADPAPVPTRPVAPVPLQVLGLGLILGLTSGMAAAIVRSRLDTRLYSEDDVRRAWGGDADVDLLVTRRGRAARSALTGRPARALARRMELAAEDGPIRVAFLSPSPDEVHGSRALAEEVAAQLQGRELTAIVTSAGAAPLPDDRATVRLEVTDPLAPLRFWRDAAARYDGVVLVIPRGRVDAAELREVRVILRDAGLKPLALVMTRRTRATTAPVVQRAPSPVIQASVPAEPRPAAAPARR